MAYLVNFIRSKTFFISLLGLLIVGAVLFITLTGNRVKYGEADSSLEVIKRAQQFAAGEASRVDTDKDGLYDWEETLWGSDPKKSDTDGDGSKDGEEVDDDRSPIVAGPNDELSVNKNTGEVSLPGQSDAPNETEKLAGEFFNKYFALRQGDELRTETGMQELFAILMRKVESPATPSPSHFSSKDILVGGASAVSSERIYGNVVGSILTRPINTEKETVILLRALETDNPEELDKLKVKLSAQENMLQDLKGTVVPSSAAAIHLELLNTLYALNQTLKDMQQAFTDPLVMMRAMTRYESEAIALGKAIINIRTYLVEKGITFEATEPGYVLLQLDQQQ